MGSFKLGRMTMKSLLGKPATAMYPVVLPTYFDTTKGHIDIDIDACIFCGNCAKKCPAVAIRVDRATKTWEIDPFACVQCGSCVVVCPKKCLKMVNTYTAPATHKTTRSYTQVEAAS
jgi:ech hydrogenase subunit F